MNNIKLDIKKIVSENLQKTRKQRLEESFNHIKDIKDVETLYSQILYTSSNLIEEGYEFEEVETVVNSLTEQGIVDKALGGALGTMEDLKNKDWSGDVKAGLWSAAKEYVINYFVSALGVNEAWSRSLSIIFADMSPIEILKPFKNEQYCTQYMPKLAGAVIEATVAGYMGKDNAVKNITRNILTEALSESNTAQILSNKFCKIIH
jgi:hypothetical protein